MDCAPFLYADEALPRAILFDFDGTLASLTIDFAAMRDEIAALALEYAGITAAPAGQPVLEWIADLAAGLSASPGQGAAAAGRFRALCLERIERIELEAAQQGQLFDFTRELLRSLRRAGSRIAVVTRNCRAAVSTVFPDIDAYCDCLLPREDVSRVKPHPEHLLQALAALGCEPAASLMVGDHPLDIRTGRNAGTRTAAVASGRIGLEELRSCNPDYLARDCGELFARITRPASGEKQNSPRPGILAEG